MADLVDGAEMTALKEQAPESYRKFLEDRKCALLMEVDSIEAVLEVSPTSSQLRKLGRLAYRKAKNNNYLRQELGLPSRLT